MQNKENREMNIKLKYTKKDILLLILVVFLEANSLERNFIEKPRAMSNYLATLLSVDKGKIVSLVVRTGYLNRKSQLFSIFNDDPS